MIKVSGIVIKGQGKGAYLGFPTANVEIKENLASGVYSGKVFFNREKYKAGIFINKNILEAHIIGFNGDLYGREIEVEIGRRIREIKKFENEKDLKGQIEKDLIIIKQP